MKKLIIAIGIIIILELAVSAVYVVRLYQTKMAPQGSHVVNTQSTSSRVIPVSLPTQTGALDEPIVIPVASQQTYKLIAALPVTTQAFSMSMDYAHNLIVVTINTPSTKNYPVFQQWLIDNGYAQIPSEKFKINNQ